MDPYEKILRESRDNYQDFVGRFEKGKWAVLGFDSGVMGIAGGMSGLITRYPMVPFLGRYLAVDPSVASFFLIEDVRTGTRSNMIDAHPVPAGIFASPLDLPSDIKWDKVCPIQEEKIAGLRIDLDPVQVSALVAVNVINIDSQRRRFLGAIFGKLMYW